MAEIKWDRDVQAVLALTAGWWSQPEAGEVYGAMDMASAKLVGRDCPRLREVNDWRERH